MVDLDHIDRRIIGKLRACEKRRTPFTPGLRIIAHDLTIPLMTVWRRMHKLAARGLIVIWKAPRGMRYLWTTATFWRRRGSKWYTPPETGEYSEPSSTYVVRTTRCNGAEIRRDRTKDPPTVSRLAEMFLVAGLRSSIPWPIRGFSVRKSCRALVAVGMTSTDGAYVVRRAHDRPALLAWFLAVQGRWKDLLLDRGLGKRHRPKSETFLGSRDESVRIDKPDPDVPSLASLLETTKALDIAVERRKTEDSRPLDYDSGGQVLPWWFVKRKQEVRDGGTQDAVDN